MRKFLIASHGHFASGIKSSINILFGNSDNVTALDCYVDEKSVSSQIDQFFTTVKEDDQVVMLSDLYGGSVNSEMFKYLDKPNTFLIAGVNLALVLELAAASSEPISDEIIQNTIEQSRTMLQQVKQDTCSGCDDGDDFF